MKRKLLLISSICLCLSFIAGDCNDLNIAPVDPPPPGGGEFSAIRLYTPDGGNNWVRDPIIYPLRHCDNAYGISSFSSNLSTYSVIVNTGTRSSILATTDFGGTWHVSFKLGEDHPKDITNTVIEGKGFVVSDGGQVLMTTDAGISWLSSTESNNDLWAIEFADDMVGIIIPKNPGDSTLITTNGGLNWMEATPITGNYYINSIKFLPLIPSDYAAVCGNSGVIFKTSDRGTSWEQITSPINDKNLNSIDFEEQYGIIAGDGGTILKSTDNGRNWRVVASGVTNNFKKVRIGKGGAWIVGDNLILHSADLGETWSIKRSVANEYYYDVSFDFPNSPDGIVVGQRQN